MSFARRFRVTLVTLVASIALMSAACSGSDSSSPRPSAAPSEGTDPESAPTRLEDLDTTALTVARAPFCDAVEPAAVERALGEEPADVSAYRSGQRIRVSDDVADVVHEFGCRWTAGDNTAEAWVFAPPLTRDRADELAGRTAGQPRCGVSDGAPDFGRPSSSCESGDDDTTTTRYQGLFGDAWLTCSLTVSGAPAGEVTERASQWCAAVATGAAGAG